MMDIAQLLSIAFQFVIPAAITGLFLYLSKRTETEPSIQKRLDETAERWLVRFENETDDALKRLKEANRLLEQEQIENRAIRSENEEMLVELAELAKINQRHTAEIGELQKQFREMEVKLKAAQRQNQKLRRFVERKLGTGGLREVDEQDTEY